MSVTLKVDGVVQHQVHVLIEPWNKEIVRDQNMVLDLLRYTEIENWCVCKERDSGCDA